MTQEIKIPVSADTAGANSALGKTDDATKKLNTTLKDTAKSAESVAKSIEQIERAQRRLSAALGKKVSMGDAETFMGNFDTMRSKSASLRRFNSFDDWWQGHSTAYASPGQAARHRRAVLAGGMQGTNYAHQNGPPNLPPPGGGGGGGGFNMDGIAKTAMAWGVAGLGLAGIGGIVSSMQRGIELARTEAVTTSQGRRRMGLGVGGYYDLQAETRSASSSLYTDYAGAAQYGLDFIRGAGNGGVRGLGGRLANAGDFANRFGLDAGQSVGLFADAQRLGVAGDERGQRRLAGYIADAIDRSGYAAKADDFVKSVQTLADGAAGFSFSRPNMRGFASDLSALTSSGISGMDPAAAGALLGTADASLRGGGGAGEAGMNVIYRALSRPGMNPFLVHALMQGGVEGSTASVFGPGSAVSGMYHGKLDNQTNIERLRSYMKNGMHLDLGGPEAMAIAAKVFGLTDGGAHALLTHPGRRLSDKDIKLSPEDMGQQSLQALNGINKALTEAGEPLLKGVNLIGDTLGEIADKLIPDRAELRGNYGALDVETARGNPALKDYSGAQGRNGAGRLVRHALQAEFSSLASRGEFHWGSYASKVAPDQRDALMGIWSGADSLVGGINRDDADLGFPRRTGIRQAMVESGGDPSAGSEAGAMGLFQMMPDTVSRLAPEFTRRYGHAPDPRNPQDSARLRRMLLAQDMKLAKGNQDLAMLFYAGGQDPHNWGNRTYSYPEAIRAGHAFKIGSSEERAAADRVRHEVSVAGYVTMYDQNHRPVGHAQLKQHDQPRPSGT